MIVKRIKYTDYDGNEREEDFRFNLSESELMKMEFDTEGGMEALINKIIDEKDSKKIGELFDKIILMSYGEKSADGKRFVKSPELSKAFSETEAYNVLYMELLTDEKAAAAFVNGLVPTKIANEMQAKQGQPARLNIPAPPIN